MSGGWWTSSFAPLASMASMVCMVSMVSMVSMAAALTGCVAAPPPVQVVPMVFLDGTACSAVPTSATRVLTCSHAVPDVDEGMVILGDGPRAFRVLSRGAPRSRFEPPEWLSTDPNAAARVPDLALDWALLEIDPPIPFKPSASSVDGGVIRFDFDAPLPPGDVVTIRGYLPESTGDGRPIIERRVDLASVVFPRALAGVDPPTGVFVVSALDLVETDRGGMSGGSVARWITDVDWPIREIEIVGICHGSLVTIDPETNETMFVGCVVVRPPMEVVGRPR